MMPTESCSGVSTWNVRPNMSGDIRSATGTRTDFTKCERSPYAISSFASSLGSFGGMSACDAGVWALAGAAAPSARPASAELCLRNPRRLRDLGLIGVSLPVSSSRRTWAMSTGVWRLHARRRLTETLGIQAIIDGRMAPDQTSRRGVTVRRFPSAAEADRHELEYWRQMSDAERILQVWRLSVEQWQLRGDP